MIKRIFPQELKKGFTLTEILVVLAVFLIIIMAIYLAFSLSQRAYKEGQNAAEITQNGRVIMERIVREVRQAENIVGVFPEERASAVNEITFKDGHSGNDDYYISYFQNNDNKIERVSFYWDGEEGAEKITDQEMIVGEYVEKLEFWGSNLINISLFLEKNGKAVNLETKVFRRNF